MNEKNIHVLIADDHGVVRYGMMLLLKDLFPAASLHQASSFNEALKIIAEQHISLLILDINIAGGNNVQMLNTVKLKQPDIKVLMFSAYSEQLYAVRYIQAGADGYLHKDSSDSEIKKAVKTVLAGKNYISDTVKDAMVSTMLNGSAAVNTLNVLSNRELEVAKLLVDGLGILEIAGVLNLHTSTVSTYKARIFEKMEVKNLADLIKKYQQIESASDA